MLALEMTPLPKDIQGKNREELVFLYRTGRGDEISQLPKAKRLIEVAQTLLD